MDKFAKALMVQLWQQTLKETGPERFDDALRQALNASTYRPDVSEIRRFAGLPVIYQTEQEAKESLRALIEALRKHGRELKPAGGEIIQTHDDNNRPLVVPKRAPKVPPPALPNLVMETLHDIGFGSLQAGLDAVWAHPALDHRRSDGEREQLETFRASAGEKLERRWVEAYVRQKAKQDATKGK